MFVSTHDVTRESCESQKRGAWSGSCCMNRMNKRKAAYPKLHIGRAGCSDRQTKDRQTSLTPYRRLEIPFHVSFTKSLQKWHRHTLVLLQITCITTCEYVLIMSYSSSVPHVWSRGFSHTITDLHKCAFGSTKPLQHIGGCVESAPAIDQTSRWPEKDRGVSQPHSRRNLRICRYEIL